MDKKLFMISKLLFSCIFISFGFNKNLCLDNLRIQTDRKVPSLDVIMFDIPKTGLKVSAIDRVYFVKDNDTLDSMGYIRIKENPTTITFFYKTPRFMELRDSVEIRKEFLKEKIVVSFKKR